MTEDFTPVIFQFWQVQHFLGIEGGVLIRAGVFFMIINIEVHLHLSYDVTFFQLLMLSHKNCLTTHVITRNVTDNICVNNVCSY